MPVTVVISHLTSFMNNVYEGELYATRNSHLKEIVHLQLDKIVVFHHMLSQVIT